MSFPSSDTYGSLIEEVILSLEGWGASKEQRVTLAGSITDSATTITVDDGTQVSRGIIEIDNELIWINTTNDVTLTVPPWGRGFKGTTPAAHIVGAAVSVNPTWPRSVIAREINNTIRAVYPMLFAVKSTEFTASSTLWQYALPSDTDRVLSVEWRWNAIEGWAKLNAWELSHSADTDDFSSGKMLSLGEYPPTGATVRILYAAPPSLLVNLNDSYTLTGLSASSRDIVVLGAAARLTPWLDAGRLPVQTVEADALDTPRPLGTAVSIGKEMRARYDARLAEERRALFTRYPLRAHKVR